MVSVVRDGRRYVLEGHRGEGSLGDLLKWQMEGKRARWKCTLFSALWARNCISAACFA